MFGQPILTNHLVGWLAFLFHTMFAISATAATSYPLAVSIASGSGSVTATGINCGTDCSENYSSGTYVTLTAIGAIGSTGSLFKYWGGDCSGTISPTTIAIDSAKNCTATFVPRTFTTQPYYGALVSLNTYGNGKVGGGGNYFQDSNVTLVATPDAGSIFTGWSPSPCASSFTMPANNLTCTANFALKQTTFSCNNVTEIPVSECQSLLELYNSTNGANWTNKTGWNQTNTPCSWFGVSCSGGHVQKIDLHGNQLSGNVPNFSNLPNLADLGLSSNQLSGSIPNFNNLPNLQFLDLSSNQLSGNVPNFNNLPNLIYIFLWENQLSGSVPNFTNLPNLADLGLASNQLSGSIPNFTNLPKLIWLSLWGNQLSGSVPNFNNLPNLGDLLLSSNRLSGSVPNFTNLPILRHLELSSNELSGTIPNFTSFDLANLFSATFNNNCGLTAYDSNQETILNQKDPDWKTRNPICPVSSYNLTLNKTGNGQISGGGNFTANSTVNLTATPDTGWTFTGWSPSPCNSSFQMPANNLTCTATFSQSVCNYSLSPSFKNHSANAENGSFNVTVTSGCSWSASSNQSWVRISNPSGSGNATISYSVDANLNTSARSAIISVNGQSFTVNQAASVAQHNNQRTLILTNYQKLVELYGTADADKVMISLNTLANHSDVQGQVIRVENDPSVAATYNSRGSSYDDKNRGNAVAEAIKQIILSRWDNSNGSLQYLVFAGDDRVIPFYRIIDGTSHPDPVTLTDDFYLDHPPYNTCENCANPQIFIPDIAGGRLVESPTQIIGMIETFLANSRIYLGSAAVVGWDFLVDGAQSHCQTLQKDSISATCNLINQTWSAQDFKQQIFGIQHDVAVINLHADYNVYQSPKLDVVVPADLLNGSTNFTGKLIYSSGCHSGQNVSFDMDWPEAYATKRANYIANTGFGWGGAGVVLSEKLLRHFSEELTGNSITLGMAVMQAKQKYLAETANPREYDEKITAESTLYGLPMYLVESPPSMRRSANNEIRRSLRANTFLASGTEKTGLSYNWPSSTPVTTAQGSFYTLNGKITSADNEPILPRLANDVSRSDKALHGVVFRGGNYRKVNAAPPLQRFTTTTGHQTPQATFVSNGWYPSKFFTANTLKLNDGDKQTIIAAAGQYNPNLSSEQQRIFDNMDFDAYYHTANDWTLPTVYLTDSKLQNNLATVSVTTSDAAGIAEVVIAYTDGQGAWNSTGLTSSGAAWSGSFAANIDTEFFIQVVDNNGNVAVNDNEGKYFKFGIAPPICQATVNSDISINIPSLTFNGMSLWANLKFTPDRANRMLFEVAGYGANTNNNCVAATLSPDLNLNIPQATFGAMRLWADFSFYPSNDGKLYFLLEKYAPLS